MRGLFKPFLRVLAAMMLALGIGSAAHGAVPLEGCFASLPPASGDAERVLAPPPVWDCTSPQNRLGTGDFAARLLFAPVKADPANPLVLRFASVWQDRAKFVFRYADGTTASLAFTSRQASRYMTIGAIFELPVPTHKAPLTAIHVEIKDSANLRGIVLGATLMTRSEADRLTGWLIALYAGFAGLILALVVYNLAFWVALRHRFQLVYALMAASLAAYTFTSSGAALLVFSNLDNNDRLRINYLLLYFSGVLGLAFIRAFFGRAVFTPRLRRYCDVVSGLALSGGVAVALLAPWHFWLLDRLFFCAGLALLSCIFPIVWNAWRSRNRYFWLFMLSWGAPVAVSMARLAHGFNLIGYSFWLDNGNLLALGGEVLFSTLLIVARLRELSDERDDARAHAKLALRLANSDPLTGLLNRRAFLEQAIGRSGRFRLMLIDIDHFKAINDRYGHDAGDEMLGSIAQTIQACRPRDALAVRLGGEEFALLVPMSHQAECNPERILAAVRDGAMPYDVRVTVSIGFAEGQIATEADWRRLYRLADSALYRAKADGRDRACRATDFAASAVA